MGDEGLTANHKFAMTIRGFVPMLLGSIDNAITRKIAGGLLAPVERHILTMPAAELVETIHTCQRIFQLCLDEGVSDAEQFVDAISVELARLAAIGREVESSGADVSAGSDGNGQIDASPALPASVGSGELADSHSGA